MSACPSPKQARYQALIKHTHFQASGKPRASPHKPQAQISPWAYKKRHGLKKRHRAFFLSPGKTHDTLLMSLALYASHTSITLRPSSRKGSSSSTNILDSKRVIGPNTTLKGANSDQNPIPSVSSISRDSPIHPSFSLGPSTSHASQAAGW